MVDKEKIRQKIFYVETNIQKLSTFKGMDPEVFNADPLKEAAATRMLQVALEAMLDICCHIIAREGWGMPTTYCEVVSLAESHGLIPSNLEGTYLKMARFRNRLVHLYHEISISDVLDVINNRLDIFEPFISNVIKLYFNGNKG